LIGVESESTNSEGDFVVSVAFVAGVNGGESGVHSFEPDTLVASLDVSASVEVSDGLVVFETEAGSHVD